MRYNDIVIRDAIQVHKELLKIFAEFEWHKKTKIFKVRTIFNHVILNIYISERNNERVWNLQMDKN